MGTEPRVQGWRERGEVNYFFFLSYGEGIVKYCAYAASPFKEWEYHAP